MLDKIRELSILLNNNYNEKDVVIVLNEFFFNNFNVRLLGIEQKNISDSRNYLYPLYKQEEIIAFLEFDSDNEYLKDFLNYAKYLLSLKLQNIILTNYMNKAIEFQHSMKNIAKIIETQYELKYIIPLLGEMIDKFIQNHLVYIFIKSAKEYKLMWPNTCKDNRIFDLIKAEPLKRITVEEFGIFPLMSEGKILGYLVTKNIDSKLSLTDIEYLEELANQASTTINRANVYAEILKHATVDALTGFYNRRQLDERIKQEISGSIRQNTPLCAIMTDIDHFKNINDTYGHAVGDLVLKTVSQVMRRQLREYDVAGRYGGEEFAILLPFTKLKEAKMVAERLRKSIQNCKIDISEIIPDSDKINVTISIGIYEFQSTDNEQDLLINADKALYEAKDNGRNRVIIYEKQN